MFKFLIKLRITSFIRYFQHKRIARLTTMGLFLIVYILLFWGIYMFFQEGFHYINNDPYFGQALILYMLEMTLLLVSWMVLFSSLVSGVFGLFGSGHQAWIMCAPKYKIVVNMMLRQLVISSFWPILVVILPAFMAMHKVLGMNYIALSKSLLIVFLLLLLLSMLAIILILSFTWLLSKIKIHGFGDLLNLKIVLAAMITLMLIFISFTWQQSANTDLIKLFRADKIEENYLEPSSISAQFQYFPSHLAAQGIFYNIDNELNDSNPYLLLLAGFLVITLIIKKVLSRGFLSVWQKLSEGSYTAESESLIHNKGSKKTSRFSDNQLMAILKKEMIVAKRNLKGVFWFLFLLLVWFSQAAMNIVLGKNIARYGLGPDGFPAVVEALQFATALFFISAFVLRFAFPAFSTEGKTAWIMYSSPVSFSKIFWAKFIFYYTIFNVVGILVGYANISILGLPLVLVGLVFLLFLSAIFFTTAYGMFLGAKFPNFETDDPAILSTTLPGLAYMLGSMLYAVLGAWLMYQTIIGPGFFAISLFIALSILIGAILLYFSSRANRHLDYIKIS